MGVKDDFQVNWNKVSDECPDKNTEDFIWGRINHVLKRRMFFRSCSIGVAIVACVLIFLFIWNKPQDIHTVAQQEIYIAQADENIELPDGSLVLLRAGSSLTWMSDMSECRDVTLKGSAIFDVKSQDEPLFFNVVTKDGTVTVKGTSFSVNELSECLTSVTLLSGQVDFTARQSGQIISLKPSNVLIYNNKETSILVKPSFRGVVWRDGVFILENAQLSEIAKFVKWWFNADVRVSASVDSGQKVAGRIVPGDTVEDVLEKISFILHLNYDRDDNGIYQIKN